jgi:hypothetical protein
MTHVHRVVARLSIAAIVALALAGVTWAEGQNSTGVAYLSGGVGESGRAEIEAVQDQYSLKLVFAYTNGEFLAEVNVVITDATGNVLVSTEADGPWLLVALPAGTYKVAATVAGETKVENVSVAATGLKTLNMQWPPAAS